MIRVKPTDTFNFENPKYLPEMSACPYSPLSGSTTECNVKNPNLQDRVKLVNSSDPNYSVYTIDLCLEAKTTSESFRGEKVKYWQEKLGTAKQWAWIQGSVAALIALGATGAAVAKVHPYIVTASGVCAVVCAVICGINLGRAFEASRQMKGWNTNPLEKIANERLKAYEDGFPYVYKNHLKLSLNSTSDYQILLPFEVLFLFERHFDKFCTDLLSMRPSNDQGKKEWLDCFTDCNPVADDVLGYGYGGMRPWKYALVSGDYEVLYKYLTDIRSEFNKLRTKARQETEGVIKKINNNRKLALSPFKIMRNHYLEKAFSDFDEKFKGKTDSKEIQKINKEYSAAVSKYKMFYKIATTPVHLFFNQQVSEANAQLNSALEKINENEASSHAKCFDYAWGLLDHARQVKQQNFTYQPQVFFSEMVFDIPSAPPYTDINFVEQVREQQRPEGIDASNYQDFLAFLSYQQQE